MGIQRKAVVLFIAALAVTGQPVVAAEPARTKGVGGLLVANQAPAAAEVPAPVAAAVEAPAPPPPTARAKVDLPVVAEGFVATLFASAPDIISPASMCVSPEGVVF